MALPQNQGVPPRPREGARAEGGSAPARTREQAEAPAQAEAGRGPPQAAGKELGLTQGIDTKYIHTCMHVYIHTYIHADMSLSWSVAAGDGKRRPRGQRGLPGAAMAAQWVRGNASAAREAGVYVAVAGDSIGGIAAAFNTSLETLVSLNRLADVNLIQVGGVFGFCAYYVALETLVSLSRLADVNLIQVGQPIVIRPPHDALNPKP